MASVSQSRRPKCTAEVGQKRQRPPKRGGALDTTAKAYGFWLFETFTVAVLVAEFPDPSVAVAVIVYTRPLPLPFRSARTHTSVPVTVGRTFQSGAVSPSPVPFTGSLLVTATASVVVAEQPSVALKDATFTI